MMWQRLAVLLKLMSCSTQQWGSPRETRDNVRNLHKGKTKAELLLTNAEETEGEARATKCFLRPESNIRSVWDLIQVLLLLYVLVVVPLRIGFGLEVKFGSTAFWLDVGIDAYFIVDIAMNFRTAYYNSHGVLEIRSSEIARSYMRGWFTIVRAHLFFVQTCFVPTTLSPAVLMIVKSRCVGCFVVPPDLLRRHARFELNRLVRRWLTDQTGQTAAASQTCEDATNHASEEHDGALSRTAAAGAGHVRILATVYGDFSVLASSRVHLVFRRHAGRRGGRWDD